VLAFIFISPNGSPNRLTVVEINNKNSIELRLTEPQLIENKKTRVYLFASMAANPMLAAGAYSCH